MVFRTISEKIALREWAGKFYEDKSYDMMNEYSFGILQIVVKLKELIEGC